VSGIKDEDSSLSIKQQDVVGVFPSIFVFFAIAGVPIKQHAVIDVFLSTDHTN
jgi:hypothetical protein